MINEAGESLQTLKYHNIGAKKQLANLSLLQRFINLLKFERL